MSLRLILSGDELCGILHYSDFSEIRFFTKAQPTDLKFKREFTISDHAEFVAFIADCYEGAIKAIGKNGVLCSAEYLYPFVEVQLREGKPLYGRLLTWTDSIELNTGITEVMATSLILELIDSMYELAIRTHIEQCIDGGQPSTVEIPMSRDTFLSMF